MLILVQHLLLLLAPRALLALILMKVLVLAPLVPWALILVLQDLHNALNAPLELQILILVAHQVQHV